MEAAASPQTAAYAPPPQQPGGANSGGDGKTAICVTSIVLLAFVVIEYLLLLSIHLIVVPRFVAIFNDFDAQLPTLTLWVLTPPSFWGAVLCMMFLGGLIAKEFIPTRSPAATTAKIVINVLALLLGLLLFMFYFVGLMLPLIRLQESVM